MCQSDNGLAPGCVENRRKDIRRMREHDLAPASGRQRGRSRGHRGVHKFDVYITPGREDDRKSSNCACLTSVSFPAADAIEEFAFTGCTSVTSVSLPVATVIGCDAFSGCTSLPRSHFRWYIRSDPGIPQVHEFDLGFAPGRGDDRKRHIRKMHQLVFGCAPSRCCNIQ